MSEIEWNEDFDDEDNSYWEGLSPYTTETDEPPNLHWRIRQRLSSNRIEWYADHDSELGGQGEFWLSLEEAQAACQLAHDAIIDEFAEGGGDHE